ncbi:hypothetical protein ACS0TY_018037 [Phlomoides rotata]
MTSRQRRYGAISLVEEFEIQITIQVLFMSLRIWIDSDKGKIVQKCVETLDVLKVSNAKQKVPPASLVSTKWEIFESTPAATK